jgi:hypothetical protein
MIINGGWAKLMVSHSEGVMVQNGGLRAHRSSNTTYASIFWCSFSCVSDGQIAGGEGETLELGTRGKSLPKGLVPIAAVVLQSSCNRE